MKHNFSQLSLLHITGSTELPINMELKRYPSEDGGDFEVNFTRQFNIQDQMDTACMEGGGPIYDSTFSFGESFGTDEDEDDTDGYDHPQDDTDDRYFGHQV